MLSSLYRYLCRRKEEWHLLEIFIPLYLLLSVLGLMPCSIQNPHGKVKYIITRKSVLTQSLCAFFPLFVAHIFSGIYFYEVIISYTVENYTRNFSDEMVTANYMIELVTQYTFCVSAYFCVFHKRGVYLRMLKEIYRSWDALPYVNRGIILRSLRVKVNCVVFGALPLILIIIIAFTFLESASLWDKILVTFSFYLLVMLQFTVVASYFVIVLMVAALLKNIENHCKMLVKARRSVKKSFFKEEMEQIPVSLSHIQSVYVKVLSVVSEINVFFQAPILFSLLQGFHTMVINCFDVWQELFYREEFSAFMLVEYCYWLLLQLIKIYFLAYSGSLIKSQANGIGRTLHSIRKTDDKDIKQLVQIQHFSSSMTFQDTEITIFGFFPLEIPLLFNMVAATTTYLIIFVQFAKSS